MKFLFKYPTRSRPEQFKRTLAAWKENLSRKHACNFLVTVNVDDELMMNDEMFDFVKEHREEIICAPKGADKIQAMNLGIDNMDFDILVAVSDDMIPVWYGFDDIIAQKMQQYFPDIDGALNFFDGKYSNPTCCTLSIMGKKLYDRFGYIYHPSYKSVFCDNEYTEEAARDGKMVWINECIIKHDWQGDQCDELARVNSKYWAEDEANFKDRRAKGFPGGLNG